VFIVLMRTLSIGQLSTIVRCFDATRFSYSLVEELDLANLSSLALALTEYNPILIHDKPWYHLILCRSSTFFGFVGR